ncbi:MAG TPA: DUF1684 domain-containing protein [Candidatus Eisenbacteria bacterium]|nr:DUF1684 domain-containing protein [Candidatus Eisenbacteria bacterium]
MSLTLLDWRRRVHALYAEVRAADDPKAAHRLWRTARDELLATHPDSPLLPKDRAGFAGLPVAAYDPDLRFEGRLDPDVEARRLDVPTGTDGIVPFERIGVVRLDGLGELDVWWLASYGGGVFLPVKDALAGTETYGGGRYLLDTVKGADLGSTADGRLVVDLNFAYNPSCAYDPAWACPLAPPGNTLAVAVRAGELMPKPG